MPAMEMEKGMGPKPPERKGMEPQQNWYKIVRRIMKSLWSEFSERGELEHRVAINKPGYLFLTVNH
jgi:hypothetical protein